MRKKARSTPIEGFTYEVTQLGAVEGRRILVALSKIVLPTLGALVKGADLSELKDIDISQIAGKIDLEGAARAVVDAADEMQIERIVDAMSEGTEVWGPGFGDAGAPLSRSFDEHFAGRYAAMLKWLTFALRTNYSDFFGGKASAAGLAVPPSQGAPSGSPTT